MIFDVALIRAVESRPTLYTKDCVNYHSRNHRLELWQQVAKELDTDGKLDPFGEFLSSISKNGRYIS